MYLGLDLSLNSTGACILADSKHAETRLLKPRDLIGIARVRDVCRQLEEFIDEYGGPGAIELACIENYALGAHGKTFHLAELGGVVRDRLYTWDINYIAVQVQHLKQFATGNGNADKAQIGQVLKASWGKDFAARTWAGFKRGLPRPDNWGEDDKHWRTDEADAYVLANIAAYYSEDWDRFPSVEQRMIIQSIKLDPQAVLSKAAKDRKANS